MTKKANKQKSTNFSIMSIYFKSCFFIFYLVLVSFPIMSSNTIVPNEEILEKPFPLPYERIDLSENDLKISLK